MYDLEKIMQNSEPVGGYLSSIGEKHPSFSRRKADYRLDGRIVEELKRYADKVIVVIFSAEWCPDCARNVPVLDLIAEATGMEVRIFGHLMRDPLNPMERWRIPPSPPEVREFNVVKISLIVVLNRRGGRRIGEVVENPPEGQSLEEALLQVLKRA